MPRTKHQPPPRKVREPGEFDSFVARPSAAVMVRSVDAKPAAAPVLKVQGRVKQSIRDSARGEECTLQFDHVCNRDPATSVWCHWPGLAGDRGMAIKAIDLAGCVGCSDCHDVLDGRRDTTIRAEDIERAFLRAHLKSLVMLARKGLL